MPRDNITQTRHLLRFVLRLPFAVRAVVVRVIFLQNMNVFSILIALANFLVHDRIGEYASGAL